MGSLLVVGVFLAVAPLAIVAQDTGFPTTAGNKISQSTLTAIVADLLSENPALPVESNYIDGEMDADGMITIHARIDGQEFTVILAPAEMGLAGSLTLAGTEAPVYTVAIVPLFPGVWSSAMDLPNIAEPDETFDDLFCYNNQSVNCTRIWRFQFCVVKRADGTVRYRVIWDRSDGKQVTIYDSGWQPAPAQAAAASLPPPPEVGAAFWALFTQDNPDFFGNPVIRSFLEQARPEFDRLGWTMPELPAVPAETPTASQ